MRAASAAALFLAALQAFSTPVLRFTGSLNGRLEGCDCKVAPAPGLLKLAARIHEDHRPGVDLLVDAGDVLDGTADALLGDALAASYEELGYAAVAVGERDLLSGVSTLLALRQTLPFLCNNLSVRDATGSWVEFSAGPVLVRRDGRLVGVMALLDPDAYFDLPAAARGQTRVSFPAWRARKLATELRRQGADTVVLLYHGGREAALRLARSARGVDVLIYAGDLPAPATVVGSTVLVSLGAAGSRIGTLDLGAGGTAATAASGATVELDARFGPDDPAVLLRVEAYNKALRARLGATSGP